MTYSKNSSAGKIRTAGALNLQIKDADDVALTNALSLNDLMKYFGHENTEVPFVVVLIGATFFNEGGPVIEKENGLLTFLCFDLNTVYIFRDIFIIHHSNISKNHTITIL